MPLRTCIGCRAVRPQSAMIRLARDAAGTPRLDPRRWRGRGAYLCDTHECLERALARRAIPRALGAEPAGLDAAALRGDFARALQRRGTSTQRGAEGQGRQTTESAGGL